MARRGRAGPPLGGGNGGFNMGLGGTAPFIGESARELVRGQSPAEARVSGQRHAPKHAPGTPLLGVPVPARSASSGTRAIGQAGFIFHRGMDQGGLEGRDACTSVVARRRLRRQSQPASIASTPAEGRMLYWAGDGSFSRSSLRIDPLERQFGRAGRAGGRFRSRQGGRTAV